MRKFNSRLEGTIEAVEVPHWHRYQNSDKWWRHCEGIASWCKGMICEHCIHPEDSHIELTTPRGRMTARGTDYIIRWEDEDGVVSFTIMDKLNFNRVFIPVQEDEEIIDELTDYLSSTSD